MTFGVTYGFFESAGWRPEGSFWAGVPGFGAGAPGGFAAAGLGTSGMRPTFLTIFSTSSRETGAVVGPFGCGGGAAGAGGFASTRPPGFAASGCVAYISVFCSAL